jgi:hypothetical protein
MSAPAPPRKTVPVSQGSSKPIPQGKLFFTCKHQPFEKIQAAIPTLLKGLSRYGEVDRNLHPSTRCLTIILTPFPLDKLKPKDLDLDLAACIAEDRTLKMDSNIGQYFANVRN